MLDELLRREADGNPIRVGLVGAGSMGCGVAHQIGRTPGMRLSFVADTDIAAASRAAARYGKRTTVHEDALATLRDSRLACDVLVEATNSILAAYDYCLAAIDRNAHCVLMNAEVDVVLGHLLRRKARPRGVVVTSDAGDQHGVLSRLLDEIGLWGLEIVQIGNMKGFLDRHRDLAGSVEIARSLNLSTEQCLAYTDGSKLNIEMSIIANEFGLTPLVPGMRGPRAERVEDALQLFDFGADGGRAHVDYILGARQHGGGVYVVVRCEDDFLAGYLKYYKVPNSPPYFLFLRPYHLCHLETPRAIALAALYGKATCSMRAGRVTDSYAYAKRALGVGERIAHAIGSDEVYGLAQACAGADEASLVPQGLLHIEGSRERPVVRRQVAADQALRWDDIELPATRLFDLWQEQQTLLAERPAMP